MVCNRRFLNVEEGENDTTYAGGKTGRETIERFVGEAKSHLNTGGFVLLLISSLTGEKEVSELLKNHGMSAEIISREKVPWEELLIIKAVPSF